MLAVAEDIDVPDDDHIAVGFGRVEILFKCSVKHLRDLIVGIIHPFKHFQKHARCARRGIPQSLPVRIISQSCEDAADVFFYRFLIDCHL